MSNNEHPSSLADSQSLGPAHSGWFNMSADQFGEGESALHSASRVILHAVLDSSDSECGFDIESYLSIDEDGVAQSLDDIGSPGTGSSDFLRPPLSISTMDHIGGEAPMPMILDPLNMVLGPGMITPEVWAYLGDLGGRRLSRAKSAPSSKVIQIFRGLNSYDRPSCHVCRPSFIRAPSGPFTPQIMSPSPCSAAVIEANANAERIKRNYLLTQSVVTFTTKNETNRTS